MQNKSQNKPKETISFSNLPSIIVTVIFIVGFGAVFGLLGYLVSGIKKNVTPVVQRSSVKITDRIKDEYFGNNFIQVKSPQKNAVIKNPVLVSGKADVYEGTVRIRITDNNENVLANIFTTANGSIDELYPFKKEIGYKTPQTENGLMEIFEESVKDGSEVYKVEIPVVFENYEDIFSDWKVYRNEEFGYEIKYLKNIVEIFPDSVFERGSRGNPSFRIKSGGHFAFGVWENPERLSFKGWLEKGDAMGVTYGVREIMIGDHKGYSALNLSYSICHIEWRGIEKGNKFFTFGLEICEDDKDISLKTFDQILSTFKFIDE